MHFYHIIRVLRLVITRLFLSNQINVSYHVCILRTKSSFLIINLNYGFFYFTTKNYFLNVFIYVFVFFSLPSGMSVGRSNIKQVADKRRADIEKFLMSLFKMAPEISQSDLVYTFFHPLLRDQQNADIHLRKVKGNFIYHTAIK